MFGLPSKGIRFARRERGLPAWTRPGNDTQFGEWVREAAEKQARQEELRHNLVVIDRKRATVNSISVTDWHEKMKREIEELNRQAAIARRDHSATLAARLERIADRLNGLRLWVLAADVHPPTADWGLEDDMTGRCLHGYPIGQHCAEPWPNVADQKSTQGIADEL